MADRREDALAVVVWYSKQPHHATKLSDREIAIELMWTFARKSDVATTRTGKRDAGVILADVHRVQNARRYVDGGRDSMFEGYSFGPRKNGGGVSYSRMRAPDDAAQKDESGRARHFAAQIARHVQSASQHAAEIARVVVSLRDLLEQMKDNGDPVDRILAINGAVRDLETFGRIQQMTHWEIVKSGIPLGVADDAA